MNAWTPTHQLELTDRQMEVLELMADGWSNAAIAHRLVISQKAVVQHTSHIYDRLGLFDDEHINRRVAAAMHFRQGTIAA